MRGQTLASTPQLVTRHLMPSLMSPPMMILADPSTHVRSGVGSGHGAGGGGGETGPSSHPTMHLAAWREEGVGGAVWACGWAGWVEWGEVG